MEFSIVLVAPARGGNIGAAARAMKTMGFTDLRLTGDAPLDSPEALAFAHGSRDILEGARRYTTLPKALADVDLAVATTGRRRGKRSDYYTPDELRTMLADGGRGNRIAIVFGCEESGLSNAELDLCQIVSAVPMRRPYPSLNLAQAVMVYTYALSPLLLDVARPLVREGDEESVRALAEKLSRMLPSLGFDPGRARYKRLMERIGAARQTDVNLMHSVVNALAIHLGDGHDSSDEES